MISASVSTGAREERSERIELVKNRGLASDRRDVDPGDAEILELTRREAHQLIVGLAILPPTPVGGDKPVSHRSFLSSPDDRQPPVVSDIYLLVSEALWRRVFRMADLHLTQCNMESRQDVALRQKFDRTEFPEILFLQEKYDLLERLGRQYLVRINARRRCGPMNTHCGQDCAEGP
jgi:hypothetical protein